MNSPAGQSWRSRRVTIAGLGTFGGQVAAAKYFARLGARVTVTDQKTAEELAPSVAELAGEEVRFVFGGHDEADFTGADLVVASPAIPGDNQFLKAAKAASVEITHEMDLFFALCRAKIIGVTGSNGKSTTTALIAHILERCLSASGRAVHLGGNIGRSLLLEAANIPESDLVVLELSSFQLEDLGALDVSPWGAVVTNLSPNHLDRHKTLEAYAAAKRNITRFQGEGDFLVLNAADPALAGWEETPAEVLYFGEGETAGRKGVFISGGSLVSTCGDETEKVKIPDDWPLVGRHNLENLAAACTAVSRAGVSLAEALSVASCFRALPHRLEKIGELRGVAFYDDSIATTPESAEAALGSFDGGVVLIAGGYDKGVDLSAFAAAAAGRVRSLVVMGQTSGQIAGAALAANRDLAVVRAANLAEAVEAAYEAASPGDAVVLSPACASYDMFANFRERGTAFRGEFERMVGIKGGGAR